MQRRKFAREFKLEAVRLVRERGVAVAQAARDLDVHENVWTCPGKVESFPCMKGALNAEAFHERV